MSSVASIVVFSILACFVIWLVVDTIILIVRKTKERKLRKQLESENKSVDTTNE